MEKLARSQELAATRATQTEAQVSSHPHLSFHSQEKSARSPVHLSTHLHPGQQSRIKEQQVEKSKENEEVMFYFHREI